jgi:hypothetical protein
VLDPIRFPAEEQPVTTAPLRNRIAHASALQAWLVVFVPLLLVYVATMDRADFEQGVDAVGAALPAWRWAQFGDLDLARFAGLPWIIEVGGRVVSNRPPGIAFVSVPAYWLLGRAEFSGSVPSMLPASLTAAILSAGAVATLHVVFRRITTAPRALGGALIFGLATSTWSISANELWAHGPAQFFLALALLAMAGNRLVAAGVAFGGALLVRPVTAIIAAVTGLTRGWQERSTHPVVAVAGGALAGLALLLWYNAAVLDSASVAPAGYGDSFLERAQHQSVAAYVGDIAGMLLHPKYSVFVFSPFLLFTLPGVRAAWRGAEPWVRAAALGGLVYILVHLRLNRYWGGAEFNYRYPLEMLVMVSPLLLLSWQHWYDGASPSWRRLFHYSIPISMAVQLVAIWVEFTNPTVLGP